MHGGRFCRKYPSGGLNLNAGHFSQLSTSRPYLDPNSCPNAALLATVALMCLAQIAYQFVLYP